MKRNPRHAALAVVLFLLAGSALAGKHVQLKVVVGSHDEYADLDLELPTLVDFLSSVVKNSHKANSKRIIS